MACTLARRGGGDVAIVLVRGVRYREDIEERGRADGSRKDGSSPASSLLSLASEHSSDASASNC